MIYVPPLYAELMSTTALTPTHHGGGGGLKTVIAVVAAVAIPWAAPAIVGSFAASAALTAAQFALTSAAVGAGLGALVAVATDTSILKATIGGAIGGGLGGVAQRGGFSNLFSDTFGGGSAAAASSSPAFGAADAFNAAGGGISPAGLASSYAGPTTFGGLTAPSGPTGLVSMSPGGGPIAEFGDVGPTYAADSPAILDLSSTRGSFDPSATTNLSGAGTGGTMGTGGTGGTMGAGAGARGDLSPGPASEGSWFDRFGNKVTAGVTKALDPEKLAEKGIQAGLQAGVRYAFSEAAEAAVPEVPRTPEEEKLSGELVQAKADQERLQDKREDLALSFANQVRSIPFTGQRESTAAKLATLRASEQYLRGGPRNLLPSRQRETAIRASKAGLAAGLRGELANEKRRIAHLTAAANILPSGEKITAGVRGDIKAAEAGYKRQQDQQTNFASVISPFGDIFLPTDTDEELDEARKRLS